jgi:hypothetical protein
MELNVVVVGTPLYLQDVYIHLANWCEDWVLWLVEGEEIVCFLNFETYFFPPEFSIETFFIIEVSSLHALPKLSLPDTDWSAMQLSSQYTKL